MRIFITSLLLLVALFYAMATQDPVWRLEHRALAVPQALAYRTAQRPPSALPDTDMKLLLAAERLNATVLYVPLDPQYAGKTDMRTRVVRINESMNADARTITLAHELAHILEPIPLDEWDDEVWAETIAYLVVRPESDRLEDSARYIARYKSHFGILTSYRKDIDFAVAFLLGEAD